MDRLKIDLAHELADVLTLARARGAAADPPRLADRLAQAFGQLERIKVRVPEENELFAQLLGGERLTFACALARTVLG